MSGPCNGLTVLDLSRSLAGALTTMLLADFGADVLLVEPPEGHPLRAEPGFLVWGRGKRSLTLELDAEGCARVRELAARADVLIVSFMPGEGERLGLDWPALHALNPRLILCSLPSFGTETVEDEQPPEDALVAARAGILGAQPGFRDGPVFVRPAMSSHGAALLAVPALSAALYARERDGAGRPVQVPLWHGALAMQASALIEAERGSFPIARRTASSGRPLYRLYQCQDGRWIHIGVLTPRFWPGVALAAGHPEWISDPAYSTMPNLATQAERDAFSEMLAGIIDQKPAADWQRLFEEYDVPCAPAQTVDEFLHDDRLLAAELLIDVDDPRAGQMRQMGIAVNFQRTPGSVRGPAPAIGANSKVSSTAGNDPSLLASLPQGERGTSSSTSVVLPSPLAGPKGSSQETEGPGMRSDAGAAAADLSTPAKLHAAAGAMHRAPTEPAGAEVRDPARPLAGVRIVDLSSFIAGPLGLSLLADLGAEIIKVEAPDGDGLRGNRGFLAWSRGRRDICLDLKRPEALEVLYRLTDRADVVLENMRPGVSERLGVDYKTLRKRNPRLIYCSVTAFGSIGPYRDRPGFDPLLQARSGIERAQGGYQNPPVFLLVPVTDNTCAMLNGAGIALALYERTRSGEGQRLETSLLRAACFVQSDSVVDYAGRPPRSANDPGQYGPNAFERLYQCADGWLLVAAHTRPQREALVRLLSITADTAVLDRAGDTPSTAELELAAAMSVAFARESVGAWLPRLRAPQVPAIRVEENYDQRFAGDPLLRNAGLIAEYDHPTFGRVRQPAGLVRFGIPPQHAAQPAPLIGQHSCAILTELGYAPAQVAALIESGAAIQAPPQIPTQEPA